MNGGKWQFAVASGGKVSGQGVSGGMLVGAWRQASSKGISFLFLEDYISSVVTSQEAPLLIKRRPEFYRVWGLWLSPWARGAPRGSLPSCLLILELGAAFNS